MTILRVGVGVNIVCAAICFGLALFGRSEVGVAGGGFCIAMALFCELWDREEKQS